MQQQVQAALPVLRRLAAAGPDLPTAAGACLRVESLAQEVLVKRHVPTSPQQLTALAAALAGALRSTLGALLADWPATERHLLQPDGQPGAALHQCACVTAVNLCFVLGACADAQRSTGSAAGAGSPQAGGAALLARLVLAPSGLLPLLVQAATAAAGSLERCIAGGSSSPQLQRAVSGRLASLSVSLLRLWRSCAPLLDPSQSEQLLEVLQASIVPVARLGLALLRAAATGGSSSSSDVGLAPPVLEALNVCARAACAVADRALPTLCAGSDQELSGRASAATAYTAGLAAARQLRTHPAMLQAAAVGVVMVSLQLRHSAAAEAAEAASAGADTAARLQQHVQDLAAVPAHYPALLAALGLPGLEELAVRLQVVLRGTTDNHARALTDLSVLLDEQADAAVSVGADDTSGSGSSGGGSGSGNSGSGGGSGGSGSGGSGSGSEGDASHLLTRLAPAALEAAALMALVVAASGRDQASSHAAHDAVIAGLAAFRASMRALAVAGAADPALGEGSCVPPPAGPGSGAAPPSWERDAQPPPPQQQQQQQQQLDASLCSEALLVLVPAVQRACSAARQQAPEFVAEWEEALSCTLLQALLGPSRAPVAALSEAVLQQPLCNVAALEAALRWCATGGETGFSLAKCSWVISAAVDGGGPLSWDEPDTWGQLDALAAAAAADPGGLGRRAFALLLSCAKAARPALTAADSSSLLAVSALCTVMWAAMKQGGPQLLVATASVLQATEDCTACPAAEQAACSAGDQLSSSSGGSSWPHGLLRAPLMPWLVLVARCLEAFAWWCQLPDELHRQQREEVWQLHAATAVLATGCHCAVVWLGLGLQQLVPLCQAQPGEAQAAAGAAEQRATLEQLLAQQAQLQASLELAVDSDGSSLRPFDATLAAQLQAFAVGVVRELPLRLCCNSPACTSMRCASELLLVGGKACICAGCGIEAARYCSRDCQAAHWKQHRRACKRLAAVLDALSD